MIHILFVCLGNICRSPMAEGIFLHLLKEESLERHFIVDSCGTSNYHCGSLPDPRMQDKAKEYQITLFHKARQLTKNDLDTFDYILAMDQSNYQNILSLKTNPHQRAQVLLMREFDEDKTTNDVPDPYFGTAEGFEEVFRILERSNRKFLKFLKAKHL